MSKREQRKPGNRGVSRQVDREARRQGDKESGTASESGLLTPNLATVGGGEAAMVSSSPAAPAWSDRLASLRQPHLVIPMLALLGILDSIYLSYVKIAHAKPFCAGLGDCETVNTSVYSEFAGIPIAYLGVLMYATIFVLSFWGPRLPGALASYAPLIVMGMAFGGVLYSAYLTYLELYVIEAICAYCVVSAILITLIFVWSIWQYWRGQPASAESY